MIAQPGSRFAQPPCFLNYVGQVPHSEAQELVSVAALTYNPPMSTELEDEQQPSSEGSLYQVSQRIDQMQARIDNLLRPANLASQLYYDRRLTRDEWYAKYADIGFQLLMRTLIKEGVSGDTKAADLGMKYLTQWLDRTRQGKQDVTSERTTEVQGDLLQRPRSQGSSPQDVG